MEDLAIRFLMDLLNQLNQLEITLQLLINQAMKFFYD